MHHLFFAHILLAANAAEGVTPMGTPVWVPLLIAVILLLMLWWGLTRNSIPTGAPAAAGHGHEADAHAHDAHGHDAHAAEAAPAMETRAAGVETAVANDLKIIEGIGPKIERILHDAGIKTFADLAAISVAALEKIVREEAGIRVAFPETWPEQAKLAAAGEWSALETLQEELRGGRRAA